MNFRNALSLFLIVALSFFLMADMFITPAIIPELALEYGVDASTIGVAGSAFMLFGAFMGLFFGYANDHFSRKQLLIATVLLGEIPCLLTGVAAVTGSFEGFVLMRLLTGIGIGGLYPITFSLLSDYVGDKHRAKACAGVDIAWGLGMMSGPLLAGLALQTDYGWRLAFILAALPSFPLLLLYALVAREPERGGSETTYRAASASPDALPDALPDTMPDPQHSSSFSLSDFKIIFRSRSNVLLFLQGIPGSLPWGILPFWIISFFREARGFEQADATTIWELFGIATVVGGLLWAVAGDWLFNKRPRYSAMLCTAVILLGMVPLYALLNVQWQSMSSYLLLVIAGGLLISVGSANIRALLMNVNIPEHRGSVFAIYNLFDNLGKGIGPAIGGVILALTASDYQLMVNLAVSSWILCGIVFSFIIFSVDGDRQRALDTMQQSSR